MVPAGYPSKFALAGLIALSMGAAVAPARAFDEGRGSPLDIMLGLLGVDDKTEQPAINYRERAPLVLPPKTELRQPRTAQTRAPGSWPQDQEIAAANKRRADNKRVRLERVEEGVQVAGTRELAPGKVRPNPVQSGPGDCIMDSDYSRPGACDPTTFWYNLSKKKEEDKSQITAGVEPERNYLTQPPKGYMKPTKTVKATFEAPRSAKGEERPSDFFREKRSEE